MTDTPQVIVTGHALVRYFERVEGVNIAAVRRRMRAEGVDQHVIDGDNTMLAWMNANGWHVEAVRAKFQCAKVANAIAMGAVRVMVDGVWATINRGVVATIYTAEMLSHHRKRPQRKERRPYHPRPHHPRKKKSR